jgi:hypothetical protein
MRIEWVFILEVKLLFHVLIIFTQPFRGISSPPGVGCLLRSFNKNLDDAVIVVSFS